MIYIDDTSLLNDNIIANKKNEYLYQLKTTYHHPKNELYSTCTICLERFHWIHSKSQFLQLINDYVKDEDNFDMDMMHFYNNSYWPGRYELRYNISKNMCEICYIEQKRKASLKENCKIYFVVIFHLIIVGIIIFALCMYT